MSNVQSCAGNALDHFQWRSMEPRDLRHWGPSLKVVSLLVIQANASRSRIVAELLAASACHWLEPTHDPSWLAPTQTKKMSRECSCVLVWTSNCVCSVYRVNKHGCNCDMLHAAICVHLLNKDKAFPAWYLDDGVVAGLSMAERSIMTLKKKGPPEILLFQCGHFWCPYWWFVVSCQLQACKC